MCLALLKMGTGKNICQNKKSGNLKKNVNFLELKLFEHTCLTTNQTIQQVKIKVQTVMTLRTPIG
jgi:hypothetical protein